MENTTEPTNASVIPAISAVDNNEEENIESVKNTSIDDEIYFESLKNAQKENYGVIFDGDTNKVLAHFAKREPAAGYDAENYMNLMEKTQRTIKDLDGYDNDQYKRWLKERHFNPISREEKEFEELLRKAGLTYGFNIPGVLNLKNNYNGKTSVKISRKTASIAASDITDEDKIRVAVMGIKDKVRKPTIIEPSRCSPDQALTFIRTATRILLEECDGKFELSDIKIANKAYRDIILKEFEGYRVKASIGESDVEYTDEHKNGRSIKEKIDNRSEGEKIAFDAGYDLLKSVEAARNRIEHSTRFMQIDILSTKKKNLVGALNDTFAGKETNNKLFDDNSVKASFANLLKSADRFEEVISGFDTVPDNLKEAYSALNLLKETGFNPSSKNRKSSILNFGHESQKTLKNVAKNLQIVEALILKNTDMDVARLNKNDSKAVLRLSESHRKIKNAIENNDVAKFSKFSDVVKGYDLNNVLNNGNGTKIFPDNAEVYKFAVKGEAADIYVFRDVNSGTVYEVNGSGNRYDKKQVSNLNFKEVVALHTAIKNSVNSPEFAEEQKPVENKVENKEEIKPEAPVVQPEPVVVAPAVEKGVDVKYDFSEFDNDNLKAPEIVENLPVVEAIATVPVVENAVNSEMANALEYVKIPVEKMLELVKVCNCHGKLLCEGLEPVQAEFNKRVSNFLEAEAPTAENFHMAGKGYVEVREKVITLGNQTKEEIKQLDKDFGVDSSVKNKVEEPSLEDEKQENKKRPNLFNKQKGS